MSAHARRVTLATLLLCAFVVNVDVTLINVTLPTLVRELGASTRSLQWIVDAYTLVFASFVLAAGALSDRFGRKGMLLAGLGIYAGANLAAGLVDSVDALIALRAVSGLGAAMIYPSTLSIITNVYTDRRARAKAIGAWGAVSGAAVALGPIVGGACLEQWSWHSSFLIKVPVAIVAALAVLAMVPTSRDPQARRIDRLGLALTVLAVSAVVFAVIEAPTSGWLSAQTLALLAAGVVFAATWVLWERRTSTPMFDLALLSDPRFAAASSAITVAFFALAGFTFLITQFFQFLDGYSPLEAGVRLLPVASAVAASSIGGTQLAERFGVGRVVPAGLLCLAGAYMWVSTADETTTYLTIAGQMVALGTGMGLTSAPATNSLMSAASDAVAGVASAVNDTTRELGSTLGVAVIGSVFNSLYRSQFDGPSGARLPHQALDAATDSVGAAFAAAGRLQGHHHPQVANQLRHLATDGFVAGLQVGCYVAAGVCAAGAVGVGVALRRSPSRRDVEKPAAAHIDLGPPRVAMPAGNPSVAEVLAARLTIASPRNVLRFLHDAVKLSDEEIATALGGVDPQAVRERRTSPDTGSLDLARLDDLRAIVTQLVCSTRLRPDEIGRFLRARNIELGNERPLAWLGDGDFDGALRAADTLVRGLRESPPTELSSAGSAAIAALHNGGDPERALETPPLAL